MSDGGCDQQLLQLVSGQAPATMPEAIAIMQAIDSLLSDNDGLKWFNLLYLTVTQRVASQPPGGGWQDPVWLARLDVIFANLYFSAAASWLQNSASVGSSWKALFEARFHEDIDRIQFALAGMNAHINHDLSLALLETNAELSLVPDASSPEHADFEHVNQLLAAALPQALEFLATGLLGELAQDTGKIGRLLAIWDVAAARDLAWDFAGHLRTLDGSARSAALVAQDQMTGVLGRSLLIAV